MKNTIKFISIGMVMVLLLMSQWTVDKSVEAADAADNDVEWMDSSAAVVTHYAPGDTTSNAVFYINDADLGVTQSGTSTWTLATSGELAHLIGIMMSFSKLSRKCWKRADFVD